MRLQPRGLAPRQGSSGSRLNQFARVSKLSFVFVSQHDAPNYEPAPATTVQPIQLDARLYHLHWVAWAVCQERRSSFFLDDYAVEPRSDLKDSHVLKQDVEARRGGWCLSASNEQQAMTERIAIDGEASI